MRSFLFHLLIMFSPKANKEIAADQHPGRKPPSVMPKPPIDPPRYEPDYPDVDEMYRRFVAAGKQSKNKQAKVKKRKNLF